MVPPFEGVSMFATRMLEVDGDNGGGLGRKTAPLTATPFTAAKTTTLSGSLSFNWSVQGGAAREMLGIRQ